MLVGPNLSCGLVAAAQSAPWLVHLCADVTENCPTTFDRSEITD